MLWAYSSILQNNANLRPSWFGTRYVILYYFISTPILVKNALEFKTTFIISHHGGDNIKRTSHETPFSRSEGL